MEKNCSFACTKVVKLIENRSVPANTGISLPPYTNIDGYRFINIFVKFDQESSAELPVDLGVIFAFDEQGSMGARRYVNLEANVPGAQNTNFIEVSGAGSWQGAPHNISIYTARFPVMGPFIEVFVFNRFGKARKVSVWAYLVS